MLTQRTKKLEFPEIAVKFDGRFPQGHVNSVKNWNFSKEDVLEAARQGRMLTMDLDMPGKLGCSLRCGHCFNPVLKLMQKRGELLSEAEIKAIVKEAKALGLRSVKLIGPGEPLEEKSLLSFLDFLAELDIKPLIFTKATAIGDNTRAMRTHGISSRGLARRFNEVYGASICLGANSFDPETQARIVGRAWYPAIRNRALEMLADAGFNEYIPGEATRLAVILNPILKDNVDEIFEAYKWTRQRHIYLLSSPLMVAGLSTDPEVLERLMPDGAKLFDAYVKINVWAIEHGMYTLDDLVRDGIAAYAGGCPCQQLGLGLFVRRDGVVLRCPGNDVAAQGRIRERGLADIWQDSDNYRIYRGKINVGCPPKEGKTFPENFFSRVLEAVKEKLEAGHS